MILYVCNETNVVTEKPYEDIEAGFCIVEKYEYTYQKEFPRFSQVPEIKPYGLPNGSKPEKVYLGIGNLSSVKTIQGYSFYLDSCLKTEEEVISIKKTLFIDDQCDLVWFRVYGSSATIPNGYESCGYDITFPPEFDGAFSIINDCMFICKWHGCDEDGTAFQCYYEVLNDSGLFNNVETAIAYMKYYLSFDWTERGDYCVCEIFRKR